MPKKKLPNEERNLPGLSFSIPINIQFSISSPFSLQKRFKESFENSLSNPNKYLRKKFLEIFDVKNTEELLKKNKNIRRKINDLKNELKDEAGVNLNEFSEWVQTKIKERLDEI